MLGLILRQEFAGKLLRGTMIDIGSKGNGIHLRQSPEEFLNITYPSHDVIKALECVAPEKGKPVVIMGERGQGKSHVLATLFHAVSKPEVAKSWLSQWAKRLNRTELQGINFRSDMFVVIESLHDGSYTTLWDLLFDRHPEGARFRGRWESKDSPWPEKDLIVAMFQTRPTMLILDELGTWFDGLRNSEAKPEKSWAFTFIQILAEIAASHPDIFVLVSTVLHGNTDAYQQIHRVGEQLINFQGAEAISDRRRLLLHRLFENRINIPNGDIDNAIKVHVDEYLRLRSIPQQEQNRVSSEFQESWPFSPQLVTLLEKQLLLAVKLQETRDLIKLLANIYKSVSSDAVLITPSDVDVESSTSEFAKMLTAASETTLRDLRDKAILNIQAVRDADSEWNKSLPDLKGIMSSLWIRSITAGNSAGASLEDLQTDVTKTAAKNDNIFQSQVLRIVDSSFNIHKNGDLFVFRSEENPETRLLASARNDKLFIDGSDELQLAKEIEYVFEDRLSATHEIIVLPRYWQGNVWSKLDPKKLPENWPTDKLPIVVIPAGLQNRNRDLGNWLKNSKTHRNTYRFIFPRSHENNIYTEREVIINVRATIKASEWKKSSQEYSELEKKYRGKVHDIIRKHFSRFAVLQKFSNKSPDLCEFEEDSFSGFEDKKLKLGEELEKTISTNLWEYESFEDLVISLAESHNSVSKLLDEIREPAPNESQCIPWLGETEIKERLLNVCAQGKISILVRGTELLQANPGEAKQDVYARIKGKLGTGRVLTETIIQPPVVQTGGGTISEKPPLVEDDIPPPGGNEPKTDNPTDPGTPPEPPRTEPGTNPFEPRIKRSVSHKSDHNSPLNQLGNIEKWGIGVATEIKTASLSVEQLTGAQLNKLIRSLPSDLRFSLELVKEEDE